MGRDKLHAMPTLLCTAKYRKAFGLRAPLSTPDVDEAALGPWYGDTLNVGSRRFLHYMSAPSLLSVIIPLRERSSALLRFSRALGELLAALEINEVWIDREMGSILCLDYARASNRSDLGFLRDHAKIARHRLLDGEFGLGELNLISPGVPRLQAIGDSRVTWRARGLRRAGDARLIAEESSMSSAHSRTAHRRWARI